MQPCVFEFILAVGQRSRALIHPLGNGLIYQVDHKLVGQAYVSGRIFRCSVVAISRSEGRIGGSAPSRLKKLNGAALILPSGQIVITKAIGRGVTRLARIG